MAQGLGFRMYGRIGLMWRGSWYVGFRGSGLGSGPRLRIWGLHGRSEVKAAEKEIEET